MVKGKSEIRNPKSERRPKSEIRKRHLSALNLRTCAFGYEVAFYFHSCEFVIGSDWSAPALSALSQSVDTKSSLVQFPAASRDLLALGGACKC